MDMNLTSAEEAVMLPLVITQVDETFGCVSCLTRDGRWRRPEPVMLDEVSGSEPCYRFGDALFCRLGPTQSSAPRPEDRDLLARLPMLEDVAEWRGQALEGWLTRHCDESALAAFSGDRTVGLIRARPEELALIRSTRGRFLILLGFTDEHEQYHKWIVSDLPFSKWATDILLNAGDADQVARQIIDRLRQTTFFLAVVLSRPKQNSLGAIRGCQPLVGGVHSFPSYRDILAEHSNAAGSEKKQIRDSNVRGEAVGLG